MRFLLRLSLIHICAAQEGIVFSFKYGIDIMEQMGIPVQKIHAGHANMFLSPIFRETLALSLIHILGEK